MIRSDNTGDNTVAELENKLEYCDNVSHGITNIDASERFEAVVEAVLFATGEPLSLEKIALIVERPPAEVKAQLEKMAERLGTARRGLLLREISGKYQLCTRPELSGYVNKLFEIKQKQSLSQAAYETLSIIAYNVNVTRAVIEKIRGVNSDSPIAKLLERNLIAEAGRANLPGRPMRYDVTDEFYRLFGFKSRSDLPDIGGTIITDGDIMDNGASGAGDASDASDASGTGDASDASGSSDTSEPIVASDSSGADDASPI